jgi:hypothetical protein
MDVDRQLCPVPQTQAAQGHRDVPIDGGPADVEPFGDLRVGQALGDQS